MIGNEITSTLSAYKAVTSSEFLLTCMHHHWQIPTIFCPSVFYFCSVYNLNNYCRTNQYWQVQGYVEVNSWTNLHQSL